MKAEEHIHMNQIINCTECRRFRQYFSCLKALRKLAEQIGSMTNRLDDKKNAMMGEFWNHLSKHFPEEKKK